jgi:PAS domain S-box-containing protein
VRVTAPSEQRDPASALIAISRIISGATDMTEALRQTCRELALFTGAGTVSFHLLHQDQRMLVPFAAYHVPRPMLPTLMAATLPVDEQGFRQSVFGSADVAWSSDIQNDARFTSPLFREFPHRSGAVVPVIVDREIAGAFYLVWWTAARCFAESELQALRGIGRQVALLLRVRRLLRESQDFQQEAHAANERYRLLVERNLAGVLWARRDGIIVDCNDALARLLGYESRAALLGRDVHALYVNPDDRQQLLVALRQNGLVSNYELHWRRRDGTPIWLRVNLSQRDDGVLESILIDISDRKRAEEVQRQATELRAIATLANAASHEINNPLSAILGNLMLLTQERGRDARIDRALESIGTIRDIVRRMARITRVEEFERTSSTVPPILDIRKSTD